MQKILHSFILQASTDVFDMLYSELDTEDAKIIKKSRYPIQVRLS